MLRIIIVGCWWSDVREVKLALAVLRTPGTPEVYPAYSAKANFRHVKTIFAMQKKYFTYENHMHYLFLSRLFLIFKSARSIYIAWKKSDRIS